MPNPPCPCSSGLRLHLCCGPYLKGEREPETPEQMVRSRFTAFALRDAAYWWKTLHATHEDRQQPEEAARAGFLKSARECRYLALTIRDRQMLAPDRAHVLFHAKIFRGGRDVSFTERSEMVHDGTGWRYASGEFLDSGS